MDVWVEFRNASKWQAELLFRNFFPSTDDDGDDISEADLEGVELPTTPEPPASPSAESAASGGSTFSSLLSALTTPSVSTVSFDSLPSSPRALAPKTTAGDAALRNQAYLPPPVEEEIAAFKHTAPPLDGVTLSRFAKLFADSIPDEEFSVAALQGCESRPRRRRERC